MSAPSLTLLLPPLATPESGWPEAASLQTLLSKGSREGACEDFATRLFCHFGLQVGEGSDLPLAALGALGEGIAVEQGWWLYADPVHLLADRDQLLLSASTALGLTQGEADALVAELNRLYADDGWRFIAATPQRWYLSLPQALAMHTTPTAEAMGRRVGEVLPQGADALSWQRVMTEVQMLLHASAVNVERAAQGALVANGLWFWGGGALPQPAARVDWQHVATDHPPARGLAQLYGLPVSDLVAPPMLEAGEKVLWVGGGRGQSLEELEQEIFAPLLVMLRAGELAQLVLELPGQGRWRIDRSGLRRWWRRTKPLASWLKG